MNNIKLAMILMAVSLGGEAYSQDLLSKVPEDSKMVVALNGKGFLKHANVAQLNNIFKRVGIFKKIEEDNPKFQSENIEDLGIDLNSKSYIHFNYNDSLQFFGALIPLKDKQQFESILPEDYPIEVINGLNTVYSGDKTMRLSWDDQTLYVLGGSVSDFYFSSDEAKKKYGLLDPPEYDYAEEAVAADSLSWEEYDFDEESNTAEAATEAAIAAAEAAVAEAEEEVEAAAEAAKEAAEEAEEAVEEEVVVKEETYEVGNISIPPPPVVRSDDDFAYVDSTLERDEYQDDYYLKYSQVTAHNDSIKNIFVYNGVNSEMNRLLTGGFKGYQSKSLAAMKDNELARVEVRNLQEILTQYYQRELLRGLTGMDQFNFNYGYEQLNSSFVVEGNRMKMLGDISFDKEMTRYYKEMYTKKMNPKFYQYISEDALGLVAFNVNTEAYIKHMPALVQKVYQNMDSKVSSAIKLFSTAFDVVVDEKAVAKVFKGDNLFILNGVTQKEVKYIDYQYDDDYNNTEIEKTKMEKVPNYIWMFSSDDTRIFEQLFAFAEANEGIVNHDGIYEIKKGKADDFMPFMLIKDGIVFLGNDLAQLQQIKSNTYKAASSNRFTSMVKKNKFALIFNTKKVPSLLDDLEIPVGREMDAEVKNLAQYGDFYMINNGLKGNKFYWEAGLDFPNTGKNAIDYLINSIDNLSKTTRDESNEPD